MIEKIIDKNYRILVGIIVLFASFLRFVNYNQRFGIAYDQAHDALVARYAIESFSLPLVGPFSSGAQFQESGVWYWFLMLPTALFNNFSISPWYATTIYCILFVLAITLVGSIIVDKKFGLIAGLFTAISTSQIGQSTNLSLTALISFTSLAVIYFVFKYIKSPKVSNIFWIGFFVSLSLTIHLQAVLLLVVLPIFLFVARVRDIKHYLILILGFAIPLIPLLIFDLKNDFVNISGLLNYALNKQGRVSYEVLGRRWLTYIFVFWPTSWATIIGGFTAISYIIYFFLAAVFIHLRKEIGRIWIIIAATLFVDIILMRYVRSPLFDSYLNFLHPFIILLSAFAVYETFKWKRAIGIIFFLIVLGGGLYRDIDEVKVAGNVTTISVVDRMRNIILKKYPDSDFDFYDFGYEQVNMSLPLVLFMDTDNRTSRNGIKIGIISDEQATRSAYKKELGDVGSLKLVDLGSSSSAALEKSKWASINPISIYNNTENWYKKK